MWEDMGYGTRAQHARADGVYRRWARERLRSGRLVGWIATVSGLPAASGCVWLQEVQPRPGADGPRRPYLLSMYTETGFRGRGLATRLVREAVRWARQHGHSSVALHASDKGRSVYAKLGFEATREMRRDLR